MDKKVSRVIASFFRALRRVRGKSYYVVSVYENQLKGAIDALESVGLISFAEWQRLNSIATKQALIATSGSFIGAREYSASRANRSSATSPEKALQDEPVSEPVFASSPRRQLRVFCVLGSGRLQKTDNWFGINWRVIEYDGIGVQRSEFPPLGKHWAPPAVLVGNQERKGHSVLRP